MRCDVAHGFLGSNPGTARLAPARAIKHADVDTDPPSLPDGVFDHAPPLLGQGFDLADLHVVEVDVADECLTNSDPFHGLEVTRDAFLGDVVADPIPIAPGPGRIRRVEEPALKWVGRAGKLQERVCGPDRTEQNQQRKQLSFHRLPSAYSKAAYGAT